MRIGSFIGVPVYIGWSWLLLAAFITWTSGSTYARIYPDLGTMAYALGLTVAVGLLVSVLIHEAAHALSARAFGLRVRRIVADLMGGHTAFEGRTSPIAQGVTGLSGPLANLALAVVLYGVGFALSDGITAAVLVRLAFINVLLGIFNLLPGLPLDGGQVLMAVVWRVTGSPHRASVVAGWSGRVVAVIVVLVLVVLPIATSGRPDLILLLLAVLVAGFLWKGASHAIAVGRVRARLESRTISEVLRPVRMVPADAPISTWWEGPHQVYVITIPNDGHPIGVVRMDALESVPEEEWGSVEAMSVAAVKEGRWICEFEDEQRLEVAITSMVFHGLDTMLVTRFGQIEGIVFSADAMRDL